MGPAKKVVLIGGSPFSGKRSPAVRLAPRLGFACLSTDGVGEAVRPSFTESGKGRSVEQVAKDARSLLGLGPDRDIDG